MVPLQFGCTKCAASFAGDGLLQQCVRVHRGNRSQLAPKPARAQAQTTGLKKPQRGQLADKFAACACSLAPDAALDDEVVQAIANQLLLDAVLVKKTVQKWGRVKGRPQYVNEALEKANRGMSGRDVLVRFDREPQAPRRKLAPEVGVVLRRNVRAMKEASTVGRQGYGGARFGLGHKNGCPCAGAERWAGTGGVDLGDRRRVCDHESCDFAGDFLAVQEHERTCDRRPRPRCTCERWRRPQQALRRIRPVDKAHKGTYSLASKPRRKAPRVFASVPFDAAAAEATLQQLAEGCEKRGVMPAVLRLVEVLRAAEGGAAAVQRFGTSIHLQLAEVWELAARALPARPGVMLERQEHAWVLRLSGLRHQSAISVFRGFLLRLCPCTVDLGGCWQAGCSIRRAR